MKRKHSKRIRKRRKNPAKKLPSNARCIEPAGNLSSLRYDTFSDDIRIYSVEPVRCQECNARITGNMKPPGARVRCPRDRCGALTVVPKNKDRIVVQMRKSRNKKRLCRRRRNPSKLKRCKGKTVYGKRCKRHLRRYKYCKSHR